MEQQITSQGAKPSEVSGVIEVHEGEVHRHLSEVVRATVEGMLNCPLEGENDALPMASRVPIGQPSA
jgi:hypothetical protein